MIEEIPISKLKLLENNPRRITKDQMKNLCKSLKEDPNFFSKRPVLVNRVDDKLQVYAGNQRVRAAKKLGWKEVPCIIDENLDEKTMKARTIKDNKTFGEFDFEILANDYEVPELLKWGFTQEELSIDAETIENQGAEEETETLEPAKDEDAETKERCPNCGYDLKEY